MTEITFEVSLINVNESLADVSVLYINITRKLKFACVFSLVASIASAKSWIWTNCRSNLIISTRKLYELSYFRRSLVICTSKVINHCSNSVGIQELILRFLCVSSLFLKLFRQKNVYGAAWSIVLNSGYEKSN